MLGVPASPGATGWALIAAGLLLAGSIVWLARDHVRRSPIHVAAALAALALTAGIIPYLVWRIGEDLRYTSRLDSYTAANAGPIQAYLPGYLLDSVAHFVPPSATYATVVSPRVPWAPARVGFPALAKQALFPRRSVAAPASADYVVSWGVDPRRIAPVSKVWVARPAFASNPTVFVGKVAR